MAASNTPRPSIFLIVLPLLLVALIRSPGMIQGFSTLVPTRSRTRATGDMSFWTSTRIFSSSPVSAGGTANEPERAVVAPSPTETPPKITLYELMGGEQAVDAAVDEFYVRVVNDPLLEKFFEGTDMETLKQHQRRFLTMAFTEIPQEMNVLDYIHDSHARLIQDMGLNEHHFDLVAQHLVETLEHLGVPENLIGEAIEIVGPLRVAFETTTKDER